MNFEEMLKNMNPQMLSSVMKQMSSMISPEQMEQVQKVIAGSDKGELGKKLSRLGPEDLKRELTGNPNLAKELANNPEIMKKINQLFGKK